MNSNKVLKNSIISVIAQVLALLLRFINRRVFIMFLNIEYLGYQSVFGNIFSILSVAELGVGGIISFHLYREIAMNNQQEIGKLMYLYKWIYRAIALTVAVLGLIASCFVPYIVNDASKGIGYLYTVYFLQLVSTLADYFLSYRRTIYAADQKEYKTIEIDLFTGIVVQAVQLSLLAIFRNYLLYLSIQLSTAVIANLLVLHETNKDYPYLGKQYVITADDIQRWKIVLDVKNFLVHKIAYAIFSGTDNIVISAICGIRNVALYGNYVLLKTNVLNVLFYRLLNPVQAAIGNIVYSDREKDEMWRQFEMFDVFSFFFASYISLGFLVFFQLTIQIWLGSKVYLLSDSFVFTYSLTIYLMAVWEIVYKYRSVFGDYQQDRNCMIVSAVLNMIVSVMMANKFGIVGVQIGTIFAFLPIAYGRIRFVVGYYFGQSVKRYLIKHTLLFGVVLVESLTVYLITREMPVTVLGILTRTMVWAVVPAVINILIYFRDPHFKDLCKYFIKLFNMLGDKLKRKSRVHRET